MQVFFTLAHFVIGFVQLFAIIEFFEQKLDWGFFDVILALFVTYIPLLGGVLGVMGAMDGWGWSIWQAGALFFWFVPVYLAVLLFGLVVDRNSRGAVMSLPAWDFWFSFSVRRNRKSYLIATLLLIFVAVVFWIPMTFFEPRGRATTIFLVIFGLPWIFVSYNLSAQRLRDFGVTGWLTLVWLPINLVSNEYPVLSGATSLMFWIVLFFVPGTIGANRYGPDPLESFSDDFLA